MNTNTKTLDQEICQRDSLFGLLAGRYHIDPYQLAFGTALLMCIILWIELHFANVPLSQAGFSIFLQSFIIVPIDIILYFAVPHFLGQPFTNLEKSNAIAESLSENQESYQHFRARMISSFNNRLGGTVAMVLIAIYWLYRLFANVPTDPSSILPIESRLIVRIILLMIYTPLLYMGILTIIRTLTGLLFISSFFQSFRIVVNPINPDGAGGIGFIGKMLITSVLIATAFGGAAAGMAYVSFAAGYNPFSRLEVIVLGLIYLVSTPLLFYSLMWSPHKALLYARAEVLNPLANEFQRTSTEAIPSGKRNTSTIKSKTDRLVEIKRQYQLIQESFPIWPLDIYSIRGLLTTSVIPAISTLFSGFISDLWKALSTLLKIGKP